jgi:hypothetical protein
MPPHYIMVHSLPLTAGESLARNHLVPNHRLKILLADLSCDLPSLRLMAGSRRAGPRVGV